MNVYLVDVDNGESWEDHRHWIAKVFTTYRAASQWLVEDGYEPYVKRNYEGEYELNFYWEKEDEYMTDSSFAKIIEMELEELNEPS